MMWGRNRTKTQTQTKTGTPAMRTETGSVWRERGGVPPSESKPLHAVCVIGMALTHGVGIEITGLDEFKGRMDRLMKFSPGFERRLQKVIDQALVEVRKGMVSHAGSQIPNDDKGAKRAIRRIVYRQIIGGQVNILKKRRAGQLVDEDEIATSNANQYWRRRGYKTGQMLRYNGSDRGFILRFANAGTVPRTSTTMDAHPIKRKSISERPSGRTYKSSIIGYRGRMGLSGARDFFKETDTKAKAEVPELSARIQQLIVEEFNA